MQVTMDHDLNHLAHQGSRLLTTRHCTSSPQNSTSVRAKSNGLGSVVVFGEALQQSPVRRYGDGLLSSSRYLLVLLLRAPWTRPRQHPMLSEFNVSRAKKGRVAA
jgi:hypothetical protein